MTKKQFNPRETYERFCDGDSLTDDEILAGIVFFNHLNHKLNQIGPIFKLSSNEAYRVWNRLYDIAVARDLNIETDPYENITEPEISWKNTLNSDLLPTQGMWWYMFVEKANFLGYPYFAWDGFVYETKTHKNTNIPISNLK